MLEKIFKSPTAIRRYRSGTFGLHLDGFVGSLLDKGYPRHTIHAKLNRVNALGKWLERQGIAAADFERRHLQGFLDGWRRDGRFHTGDAGTVHALFDYLLGRGIVVVSDAVQDQSPLANLEREYERYLIEERGLCRETVTDYLRCVHRFLVHVTGGGPLRLRAIESPDVASFMLGYLRSTNLSMAKNMAKALRSFLRFLFLAGKVRENLSASVPTIPGARLATIPKYLSLDDVERVVEGCIQTTAIGRRDRAILLLLARLGLRAGEVVALTLDHIDWRAGEIVVHGKGLRHQRMPLPVDVGQALAVYIRQDRPRCESRRVFIRQKAPYRGLGNSAAVSGIARQALERAGVGAASKGAHVFRHSLATGLLHHGASLTEIGEVLRHESLATTEIYAKVDLNGLRRLARPWPWDRGVR